MNKKQTEKEIEKDIDNAFSKKDLIKLLNGATREHINLVKYLYDNHIDILRKYEKASGYKCQIHFAGEVDNGKKV